MITPNLKKDDIEIFNKRELPLYAVRNVDKRTFLGLRLSELLLFTGFVLILLNNLGIIMHYYPKNFILIVDQSFYSTIR